MVFPFPPVFLQNVYMSVVSVALVLVGAWTAFRAIQFFLTARRNIRQIRELRRELDERFEQGTVTWEYLEEYQERLDEIKPPV